MTYLFIGGEDTDFVPFGQTWTADAGTTAAYRSGYARFALTSTNASGGDQSQPLTQNLSQPASSFWTTFRGHVTGTPAGTTLLAFYDAGGLLRLTLKLNADSTLSATSFSDGGSPTLLKTSTAKVGQGQLSKFDVQVSYGTAGVVNVYLDQVQVIAFSGATSTGSAQTLAAFAFFNPGCTALRLSEIIVAQRDTRTLSLVSHAPAAAGSTSDWTGTYGDIDETAANGTDMIYTANAGTVSSYGVTPLPTGSFAVRAVKVSASAAHGDTGPTSLQLGLRVDGSYAFANAAALDTGWTHIGTMFETNPVTQTAFTQDEIGALEIAFKSQS